MKRILLIVCAMLSACGAMAQSDTDDVYNVRQEKPVVTAETTDTAKEDRTKGVFFMQIPRNLNIKDNVFV